jgi:hypothetical protein
MAVYLITIGSDGNPSPNPLTCRQTDKISWKNNTSQPITSFTLPTCVAPQTSPAPIAVSATTRQYTVNSGTHGTYGYSYVVPGITGGPRTGTIDVGD